MITDLCGHSIYNFFAEIKNFILDTKTRSVWKAHLHKSGDIVLLCYTKEQL